MKKIFTISLVSLFAVALLTGCVKRYGGNNGEDYWLTKERGEVVYSDAYCSYYVVETAYGYNILRAVGGYKPYEGMVIYGNFSNYGTRDFYNYSSGFVFTSAVEEYWLSYFEAQEAINYYCPLGKKMPAIANPVQNKSKADTAK